jgi:hypothetical protein
VTRADVDDWADAHEVPLYCCDGFDDAILGIGQRFTSYFVVYDVAAILRILMADGLDAEGAREWFEFNIVGAWLGGASPSEPDGPPCFLETH